MSLILHRMTLFTLLMSLALPLSANTLSGRVTITDGDTVRLDNGTAIRLWGVDAPELSQTCENRVGRTVPCGLWSAYQLETRFGGQHWECRYQGKHGERVVAHCFADGLDINAHVARQGWAVATPRFTRQFEQEARLAKQERRGLWEGSFEEPWRYRQRHPSRF